MISATPSAVNRSTLLGIHRPAHRGGQRQSTARSPLAPPPWASGCRHGAGEAVVRRTCRRTPRPPPSPTPGLTATARPAARAPGHYALHHQHPEADLHRRAGVGQRLDQHHLHGRAHRGGQRDAAGPGSARWLLAARSPPHRPGPAPRPALSSGSCARRETPWPARLDQMGIVELERHHLGQRDQRERDEPAVLGRAASSTSRATCCASRWVFIARMPPAAWISGHSIPRPSTERSSITWNTEQLALWPPGRPTAMTTISVSQPAIQAAVWGMDVEGVGMLRRRAQAWGRECSTVLGRSAVVNSTVGRQAAASATGMQPGGKRCDSNSRTVSHRRF